MAVLLWGCRPSAGAPELDLPARPTAAPTGTEVASEIRSLPLEAREQRIYEEVSRGNVPTWLRDLRRVDLNSNGTAGGRRHRVTFWVTADYLAVGSDDDYLHVPLSPQTAQRIADLVGGSLPTPRMVDAIWAAARARLSPQRMRPEVSIQSVRTVDFFERHTRLIGGQRRLYGVAADAFVAGHKKDIVLTATLSENPGRVAIYGQHGIDGRPNQPLSTVVSDSLVYYNHGVRLVDRRVLVDGEAKDLGDVLRDPELAPLVSDEGAIALPRYPLVRGVRGEG